MASTDTARLPRQIPFIIGNEAAERFSFYGMRNALMTFLVGYLLTEVAPGERDAAAKEILHTFMMGVYFFPLLGGLLSDRVLGKYRTIFWLSLVYCLGQLCLALFVDVKAGFYTGLFLIALGSGGIKPCVSAFVGDQFDQTNKHRAKAVFDVFYLSINFGSFFASLLIPLTLRELGPRWAFGIPGVLMGIATLVLWGGRHRYVHVPRSNADPHSFLKVCRSALFPRSRPQGFSVGVALAAFGAIAAVGALGCSYWLGPVEGICLAIVTFMAFGGAGTWLHLDRAREEHPEEDVAGVRTVLRVLVLFALVTPFWSVFDQKTSTWILQGRTMILPAWSWFKDASQMQALNPALVLMLIPFNNLVLFPLMRKLGVEPTPLRRMGTGIAFAGVAFLAIALLQLRIDGGAKLHIAWQMLPYALLTFGEVLVSATGLEFAYSQAPAKLKSVLMSFFNLSVTVGNLWVLLTTTTVKSAPVTKAITDAGYGVIAFQMFFFAGFAFVAAAAFALYARRFPLADYYRKA